MNIAELPTTGEIYDYIERVGEKKGNLTVQALRNNQQFLDAWDSTIGRQILSDDVRRHEELMLKVYEETITPEEAAEFRYLKRRIKRIADVLQSYIKIIKGVKGEK